MYRGYGNYGGFGQAPGAVVSTTTATPGAPRGPETWGTDPVAVALASLAASILQAPYGQEQAFRAAAIQAIVQTGQVVPGNPDASQNACWTCAYVYAYYATQQLLASGSSLAANGKISGGQLGLAPGSLLAGIMGSGTTLSVSGLTHAMYDMLRADTYAMGYYGGCLKNRAKGLNCAGVRPIVTSSVWQNQLTYTRPTTAPTPAAAAAASSKTGLILGGLAVAGVAAYLALA